MNGYQCWTFITVSLYKIYITLSAVLGMESGMVVPCASPKLAPSTDTLDFSYIADLTRFCT
jgi:hypothetical protein